jgi:hypothetical protein
VAVTQFIAPVLRKLFADVRNKPKSILRGQLFSHSLHVFQAYLV